MADPQLTAVSPAATGARPGTKEVIVPGLNQPVVFPDTMSDSEIRNVVQTRIIPSLKRPTESGPEDQPLTLGGEATRKAAIFGAGAGEGALRTLGLPADIVSYVGHRLGAPTPEAPTETAAQAFRDITGAPTPSTPVERIVGRAGQEIGAAAVGTPAMRMLGLLQGLSPAKLAVMETALSGTAGTAAGVAREIKRGTGNEDVADLLTQMTTYFGVGGALGLLRMARTGAGRLVSGATPQSAFETAAARSGFGENLEAGARLNREIPGLNLTTSEATGSPTIASMERRAAGREAGFAEQLQEHRATAPGAIRGYGEQALAVPPGNIGTAQSTAAEALAQRRQAVQTTITDATQRYAQASAADRQVVDRVMASAGRYAEDTRATLDAEMKRITGSMMDRQAAGDAILGEIKAREAAFRQEAGHLFNAIDPTNTVKLPVADIEAALHHVIDDAKTSLRGDLVPAVLKNLQKKIGGVDAKAAEVIADRLGLAADDPQVLAYARKTGGGGPQEATFNELRRWRSDLLGELRDQLGGVQPNRQAAHYTSQVLDAVERTLDRTGEAATADVAERYRQAAAFYKAGVETYRQGVVAKVLQRGPRGEPIRSPLEDVPGQFLKSGNGSVTAAQQFIRAVGDSTVAMRGLRDAAFQDFLGAAMDQGALNPKRAQVWLDKHAEALRQFPEVHQEIQGLAERAGQTATKIQLARDITTQAARGTLPMTPAGPIAADQLKAAQQAAKRSLNEIDRSAVQLFVNAPPEQAVRAALSGTETGTPMRELVNSVRGDDAALRGLKRGLWDLFLRETAGPSVGAAGNPWLSASKMGTFMDRYGPAFEALYGRDAVETLGKMQRAAGLLEQGTVATAVDIASHGLDRDTMTLMQAVMLKAFGVHAMGFGEWAVAGIVGKRIRNAVDALSSRELDGLMKGILLDPAAAKTFMETISTRTPIQGVIATLKRSAMLYAAGPITTNAAGAAMGRGLGAQSSNGAR